MPVRIANWNVERAKQLWRRDAVGEMLAAIGAEIWVLTESRDSVSPGADFRLVAKSNAHVRGENDERWVSIWTRLPESRSRPTRDGNFSACAEIVVGSSVLAVYGTVLPWRGSKWREHGSANASAYRGALEAQAADWHELMGEPRLLGLCVAGDFNQDLSDKPYYWSRKARQLLEHSLAQLELVAITRHPSDPRRRRPTALTTTAGCLRGERAGAITPGRRRPLPCYAAPAC